MMPSFSGQFVSHLRNVSLTFWPKADQVQAIHAVVTGNDVEQQDLASLFATL